MKALNVIGLNSGTSMDGIDAASFAIKPQANQSENEIPQLEIKMLGSCLYEFDRNFQRHLKHLIAHGQTSLLQICRLNAALGELFADAAISVVKSAGLSLKDIDLIGSHGQTLWHAPDKYSFWGVEAPSTLQMAEPAIIAARTGTPVVAIFAQPT